MQRRRIRSPSEGRPLAPTLVIGLGVGVAVGFLVGEFFGGGSKTVLGRLADRWRAARNGAESPARAIDRLHERLDQMLGADGQSIELIPVGRNAVEVHGWVTSRLARSRALRVARQSLGPDMRLIDSLLVWGEDDQSTAPESIPDERDSA